VPPPARSTARTTGSATPPAARTKAIAVPPMRAAVATWAASAATVATRRERTGARCPSARSARPWPTAKGVVTTPTAPTLAGSHGSAA
jgi:hypothetical protein